MGDLIDSEESALYVVDDEHLGRNCSYCLKSNPSLKACSGCKIPKYCNVICQKKDWKALHKLECPTYKKCAPHRPTSSLRLLMRFLFKIHIDPALYPLDSLDLERKDAVGLARLPTSIDVMPEEKINVISCLIVGVSGIVEDQYLLEKKYLFRIMCSIESTAMGIQDDSLETVGRIVLPQKLAFINHSCIPNACIVFNGFAAEVRAICDIADGDELSIAYFDVCQSRKVRQAFLRDEYYFTCSCALCNRDDDPMKSIELGLMRLQHQIDNQCFHEASVMAEKLADDLSDIFGVAFPDVSLLLLKAFRCETVETMTERGCQLALKAYKSISIIHRHTVLAKDLALELRMRVNNTDTDC